MCHLSHTSSSSSLSSSSTSRSALFVFCSCPTTTARHLSLSSPPSSAPLPIHPSFPASPPTYNLCTTQAPMHTCTSHKSKSLHLPLLHIWSAPQLSSLEAAVLVTFTNSCL
ncbi:unnamed protein product [Mesocestoides corti]|uniref:Ovule protein n=1 Tax=Mesocestoides corti TaxID=53468 RepID=A0A0R3UDC9_MESCO|nr:unnamed protein product [Mesocestoides corti]